MPSLKEVRSRIASIKSTRQITSAMKMVSASKLRRAQTGILNLRPYARLLKQMLDRLSGQIPADQQHVLFKPNESQKVLVIAVASNKGLCGTFNVGVVKRTLEHMNALKKQNIPCELLLIGKKLEEYFQSREVPVYRLAHEVMDPVTMQKASRLAAEIRGLFLEGTFGKVDVIYNYFKNAIMQELVTEQILPVPTAVAIEDPTLSAEFDHILEPSSSELAESLVMRFVDTNFYRILLDSSASEHGARMTAMHKATDNATELLKNLTLAYNKVRQSMITREIMEIVAGAEVMNE